MSSSSSSPSLHPIVLSIDPGHDDAFALLLALYCDQFRVLCISTAAGNQTIEKTTDNALRMLQVLDRPDIPVYKGRYGPLLRPVLSCGEIHGSSGLDCFDSSSVQLPPLKLKHQTSKGHEGMFEALVNEFKCRPGWPELQQRLESYHPGPPPAKAGDPLLGNPEGVTIVATGPLTDVALLLLAHPEAALMIDRIVIMGGAIGHGNISPAAEFNILVDPEAAHVVFSSGLRIDMAPLEITHQLLVTPAVLDRVRSLSTPFSQLLTNLLLFFQQTYKDVFDFTDPPLHDPAAIFFLMCELNGSAAPEVRGSPALSSGSLIEYREMHVAVEYQSSRCDGRTVCDWFHHSGKVKNCRVATAINVQRFWDAMMLAIQKADKRSHINKTEADH